MLSDYSYYTLKSNIKYKYQEPNEFSEKKKKKKIKITD